jgi:hypothetical protein
MRAVRLTKMLLMVSFAACSLGASCGQRAVTLLPGIVNEPANRSLRRAIFKFASDTLCLEMKSKSLPLKMAEADPSIGRFFPVGCSVTQLGNENLFVQFVGHGYAWTNITGRMGFEAAASVEYSHDFLVDGSSMYVYFKQVQTQASSFKPLMLEKTDGGIAGGALGLLGADAQNIAKQVGERVFASQLARGFTVIREPDGEVAFSLGVLDRGERPQVPFDKGESEALVLANDRAELHSGQRDFSGPYHLSDSGHALVLTLAIDGAPGIDVLVLHKSTGDTWLSQYEHYPQTGGPPLAPQFEAAVAMAIPNFSAPPAATGPWRRQLSLPPGSYYIVFDNTASAGKTNPTTDRLDDRAALVNYAVQLVGAN